MKVLDRNRYLDAVCKMLAQGQEHVPMPIRGDSMRPFLRNADFAFLCPLTQCARPGDLVLFQRDSGEYVFHRVYRCRKDGTLLVLGDAQLEPETVTAAQLRGKAAYVRCAGQILKPGDFRWWFYEVPWRVLLPHRSRISRIREKFRKV